MILNVQIKKLKNTCVVFNSVLYKPVKTINDVDYYAIHFDLLQEYQFEIYHYAGDIKENIEAVIGKSGKSVFESIYQVAKSLDINLYFCKICANCKIKKSKPFVFMEVQQETKKDIIGNSSHCVLNISTIKNIDIKNCEFEFFPSKKIKYGVFFTELFLQLLGFFIFFALIIMAGIYCFERWDNPGTYVGPYPFFAYVIPFAIISIVLISAEIHRVAKNTIKIK